MFKERDEQHCFVFVFIGVVTVSLSHKQDENCCLLKTPEVKEKQTINKYFILRIQASLINKGVNRCLPLLSKKKMFILYHLSKI